MSTPPWTPVIGSEAGGAPIRKGRYTSAPVGCMATPGTPVREGIRSNSEADGAPVKWNPGSRTSALPPCVRTNCVASAATARSVAPVFASVVENCPGEDASQTAKGPPGAFANEKNTWLPSALACNRAEPASVETCGWGATCAVGGLAEISICARQVLHPPVAPSAASETKSVCAPVAATRAGPELVKPAMPPTKVALPVPESGSIKYTLWAPKSAIASKEPSGVSAKPRSCAFGGGPPGG